MIVEERIYSTQPGKAGEYFALYEAEGLAIQHRILGRMVGYYTTELGELNLVVHLWAYTDMQERSARRKALLADPGFLSYAAKVLPLLQKQESRILVPAPFFKPTWVEYDAAA